MDNFLLSILSLMLVSSIKHETRLNGYILTGISRFAGALVFIFVDLPAFVIANLIQTYIAFKGYVNNKKAGPSKAVGMPIKFSKSKTEKSKGAPDLGEHTKEIMQNFGYKDEEIDDFYNKKIIL